MSAENNYNKILDLINEQEVWRENCINLIASENVISKSVRAAIASDFGHRYAEGILTVNDRVNFDRFYQGTKIFDKVEEFCMKLSEKMFNADHANVVPISGAVANLTTYYALTKPDDTIAGLSIHDGGHISHTHISSAGAHALHDLSYVFDHKEMNIDVDASIKMIKKLKDKNKNKCPKLMIFGGSLFLFPHPVSEMRDIADEIGAKIMYDAAHVLGLICGGKFQQPFSEGADVVTSSTHKSFPGPQGGIVMCKSELAKKIDRAAFPGLMSNHHLHHVAGFAVALCEMEKYGKSYATQILKNAKFLAEAMYEEGFNVLCEHKGFTESHQVVVVFSKNGGGAVAAEKLEDANIIINKNLMPWDVDSASKDPSGIR
ncbi:MAG: serine hydroxymethyltransferase, partial [Candidatus Altiarchaeales archaeon HGW-Altiarchaeales-3]